MPTEPTRPPDRGAIWLGLLVLYVVWGSTYLGIAIAVETIPPFLMAAIRFVIAGTVLMAWSLVRARRSFVAPTRREWRDTVIVGTLLLGGGMGMVAFGEQTIPSGIAALLIAMMPVWVAIYRKKVSHQATKNYQLDLFDPNDGHYEYSAVTSNLGLTVRNLWWFACGRGNHEKTIAQLTTGLAFHTVPTMAYAANSAWQQLVVLTHNLLTNFQIDTGAGRRAPSRKRTVLHQLQSVQTLRFILFHRAAQLLRPGGTTLLRLTNNPATRETFTRLADALARAA